MSPSDPRASSEKLISADEAQSILDTYNLAARIVREGGTTAVLGEPTLADAVPDLARTVKALHADVARITAARDRAIAKVQQLARVITNEATTQDAVELLSAALLQDAASAPNCMEWRGDYNGRAFSIAVQWADGKSPHALIDEARAETERMRAQSDAWRVALLGIIDPLGMRAHPEHTPDDLRSFAVDVIDHRSVQYDELFDENERLQAIVDGSETAPTDEELEAHAKVNGRWRAQTFGELVADCMGPRMAAALRDNDREAGIVRKWWATTEDGTLCARPTAGGGT